MPLRYADDIYDSIESFRTQNAANLPEGAPFVQWLSEIFKSYWECHSEDRLPEIDYNIKRYENQTVEDFYDESDGTSTENKNLFKGSIIPEVIRRLVAFVVKENPRPENDYLMVKDYEFLARYIIPTLDAKWLEKLADSGAVVQNQNTGQWVLHNPKGFKELINKINDQDFLRWWRDNMGIVKYLLVKYAFLCHEAWIQMRIVDGVEGKEIVAEHVHSQNVINDPSASCLRDRICYFHVKRLPQHDVEKMYGLSKGTLECDSKFSDLAKGISAGEENPDKIYKIKRVLLTQAFLRDNRKVKINMPDGGVEEVPAYPYGRIITFVPNQGQHDYGIYILDDEANRYVEFPVQHLIFDPKDEIHGRPLVRDIINLSQLANECMQQAIANLRVMGNGKTITTKENINDLDNVGNEIGEKIFVKDPSDLTFHMPGGITAEAQGLYQFYEFMARRIMGIEEFNDMKDHGNVVSGKAMQIFTNKFDRLMSTTMEHYADMLMRVSRLYFSMKMETMVAGSYIYLDGERMVLPFDMNMFVDGITTYLSADTIMPKDEVSKKNIIMALAGMPAEDGMPYLTSSYVLDNVELDDKEKALRQRQEAGGMQQQLMQAQQAIEQLQMQLQQIGGEYQSLQKEHQDAQHKITIEQLKSQTAIAIQQMKDQGMGQRDELSQQIKLIVTNQNNQTKTMNEFIKANALVKVAATSANTGRSNETDSE